MKDPRSTRKDAMRQNYDVKEFPSSGSNLTYNSHVGDLVIGRLYPLGYAHLMPHDKFSAKTDYKFNVNDLTVPVLSPVSASIHHFFVTYRSVDRGFEDLLTPTKLNNMSSSLHAPMFNLRTIAEVLVRTVFDALDFKRLGTGVIDFGELTDNSGYDFDTWYSAFTFSNPVYSAMQNSYIDDAWLDLFRQLYTQYSSNTATATARTRIAAKMIFDFFCGEKSLMDFFGYNIVLHEDVDRFIDALLLTANNTALDSDFWDSSTGKGILDGFDAREQNEYALRACYAIWYEHYRNDDLEPRSATLPYYRDWGSTSLIGTSYSNAGAEAVGFLCTTRIRSWQDDPFNTCSPDDISRHVYAPITMINGGNTKYDVETEPVASNYNESSGVENPHFTGNTLVQTTISYIDTFGVSHDVVCPLPSALRPLLANSSSLADSEDYAIDLQSLRKSQMLRRFLTRNLIGGDEYKDRMKLQFDSTIEDYRVNRPIFLGGSVKPINFDEHIASSGVEPGTPGTTAAFGQRLVVGHANTENVSNGVEMFTPEFGIFISMGSVVPMAQYNPQCPQNFIKRTMDFPHPVFAETQEDIMNNACIYRIGYGHNSGQFVPFAHVPYGYAYRYRVDEVHGSLMSERFDYTFARFYRGLTSDSIPKFNYAFLHCRPSLPMFVNSILLDGQLYGTVSNSHLVERLLPQPIESV